MKDVPPFVREHPDRPLRSALSLADHADEGPVDAYRLHRLEILYDSFLGHVPGNPVPVDAKLLTLRSVLEVLLNCTDAVLGEG